MSKAGNELYVTPGAVSRQIKALEADLNADLFVRKTREIVLTHEGVEFHRFVSRILAELIREADRFRDVQRQARLTISTSVSFASRWFAPRLHRLMARLPELDIHLDVTDVNINLYEGHADAAIRYGEGTYPHVVSERVLNETVSPVCSPDYLKRVGDLTEPRQLIDCALLHEEPMRANWTEWFTKAGLDNMHIRGPVYSHGSHAVEAAMRGEGMTLGRSVLVAADIAAGSLVEPFPSVRLPVERGYDFVYRPDRANDPKVQALRSWLLDEIERESISQGDASTRRLNNERDEALR
jgi:LysR family glycine cleavage system transcriptional activator